MWALPDCGMPAPQKPYIRGRRTQAQLDARDERLAVLGQELEAARQSGERLRKRLAMRIDITTVQLPLARAQSPTHLLAPHHDSRAPAPHPVEQAPDFIGRLAICLLHRCLGRRPAPGFGHAVDGNVVGLRDAVWRCPDYLQWVRYPFPGRQAPKPLTV